MNNEEVLPSATVSVGKRFILSNGSGEFLLSLPPGRYKITVTHSSYQKQEQELTLEANETVTLQINMTRGDEMSGVMILGSRSSVQRTTLNTPVPVDVIPVRNLPQGAIDLTQKLAVVVPSFNSPPQTTGLAAHINPATLRGLAPDQTLVLLEGRRRA